MQYSDNDLDLNGFQVIEAEVFRPRTGYNCAPACTIWPDSIKFNMRSVGLLNSCENIILKVNKTTQGILIIPSNSREPESFKWLSEKAKVPRQMTCPEFTDTLYRAWGWDFSKRYRSTGRIVTVDNKVMLLFNFSTPFICNKDEKPANLVHKNVER